MTIESIRSVKSIKKIAGKKVLLRADFNVPLKDGKIKDDYKIMAEMPTIRFLIRYKCKVIIATHLGRPDGRDNVYSVKPIAKRLSELLGKNVKFVGDSIGLEAGTEISKMDKGDVILLENLRFYKEEKKNNKKFAKELVYPADIYVNDAFGASHREHASVCAIKKYKPSYAGLLLEKEIINLKKILRPKKPLVAVIGGAKIETKLPLLKKIRGTANQILVGGALANNFLYALKYEVGRSLMDKKSMALTKKIISMYKMIGIKKFILPVDVVVGSRKDGAGKAAVKKVDKVSNNDIIFDIGPETIKLYSKYIKGAKTIAWNGPMGKFESERFRHGTLSIARVIASRSSGKAYGVVGGGETIEALRMTKMLDYVDWVSTGGGAMLSFLGGEKMPGLEGIIKY
jgi:phosphoglycerate kinase